MGEIYVLAYLPVVSPVPKGGWGLMVQIYEFRNRPGVVAVR